MSNMLIFFPHALNHNPHLGHYNIITIQLKLVNTDLFLTQILRVTIGLQTILKGCRRAVQLNMSLLLVGDW
jgi:hypothetical protein